MMYGVWKVTSKQTGEQLSNCNISGACIIDSVKPSSQLHSLEKSWICPCNLITEQLGQIFLKKLLYPYFVYLLVTRTKHIECIVQQFKLVFGFVQTLLILNQRSVIDTWSKSWSTLCRHPNWYSVDTWWTLD